MVEMQISERLRKTIRAEIAADTNGSTAVRRSVKIHSIKEEIEAMKMVSGILRDHQLDIEYQKYLIESEPKREELLNETLEDIKKFKHQRSRRAVLKVSKRDS